MNQPSKGKLQFPTKYASGYSLDLYCDHYNAAHDWEEFPHQYTGESFAECARLAVRDGWIIRKTSRTATCPRCNPKFAVKTGDKNATDTQRP